MPPRLMSNWLLGSGVTWAFPWVPISVVFQIETSFQIELPDRASIHTLFGFFFSPPFFLLLLFCNIRLRRLISVALQMCHSISS